MTDYYDVRLKQARVGILQQSNHFTNITARLEDQARLEDAVGKAEPDVIVHLAAQAGVRYSLEAPRSYVESNVTGSFNLLEAARLAKPAHVLMASTSSVYGANTEMPFTETQRTDAPLTIYSATKKSMEAMGHSYAHLWKLPVTCFRFFTVYGPWGRPDMALFKFTDAIRQGKPIDVYGQGQMSRDFTYIDDIVEGVIRVVDQVAQSNPHWSGNAPDPATSYAPYRNYNIGNNQPIELMHFIATLENCLGMKAEKNLLPIQPGDLPATYADVDALVTDVGFKPNTSIEEGIEQFVKWYRSYYQA
jgi:UDP-glucuronate 4-epimerase